MDKLSTTGADLVRHWQRAGADGWMNKNSAQALQTACQAVLSVQDGWESMDVSAIRPEEFTTRFNNRRAGKYAPKSLADYARRFEKALKLFLEYVRDPAAWRPPKRTTKNEGASRSRRRRDEAHAGDRSDAGGGAVLPADQGQISYPFPLADGQVAHLSLPRTLTLEDVDRLSAFIRTLAKDFDPRADARSAGRARATEGGKPAPSAGGGSLGD